MSSASRVRGASLEPGELPVISGPVISGLVNFGLVNFGPVISGSKFRVRRFGQGSILPGLAILLWVAILPQPTSAQQFPEVPRHDLQCGDVFPCPEEIQRRVDFWVMVFREWETDQRILHDSEHPARVYTVLRTVGSCSTRRPTPEVAREKQRIINELNSLANGIANGTGPNGPYQRELIKHFNPATSDALRAAAGSVRCQSGNRDRFQDALHRFGRYRATVLRYLEQAGLSSDIQYLPFVESAYNPAAYSHAGAAGIWQIMPKTARTLGLQISSAIDERYDPELASGAAAKYLKDSTGSLSRAARDAGLNVSAEKINPFVITSYNYGVAGMRKAIAQVDADYVRLLNEYKSRTFQNAVKNFYSSFLAARFVARNAGNYFGEIEEYQPVPVTRISLAGPTSAGRIKSVFGVSEARLKDLNPALTSRVWKGQRLIPTGYVLRLPRDANDWSTQLARLEQMPPEGPSDGGYRHLVLRGDTACAVANEYDVSCRDLIELNRLDRRATIYLNQELKIPSRVTISVARASNAGGTVLAAGTDSHTVRRGQTPCGIAGTYGVNCSEFLSVNNLSWRDKIFVGQNLVIPVRVPSTPKITENIGAKSSQRDKDTAGTVAEPSVEVAVPSDSDILKPLFSSAETLVSIDRSSANPTYSLLVLSGETLGHYADWLGIGGAAPLRNMNNLRYNDALQVGKRIRIPVQSDQQLAIFEESRADFHRLLAEEYVQHYMVTEVDDYRVRRGDTLWQISRDFEIPLWVLYRYNPSVRDARVGQKLLIPMVKERA